VLAVVVACVCAAAAPSTIVISEVKDADDVPGVRAEFDVDADPDALLQLLWDVSQFKLIFPDIKELTIKSAPDDRTVVVEFAVNAVVKDLRYTLRRVVDREQRSIRWVSVAGDLKKIVGHWQLTRREGGGCHVVYQSIVDVGFVPGASTVYRAGVLAKMNEVVGRVKNAAEKLPKQQAAKTPPTTNSSPALQ